MVAPAQGAPLLEPLIAAAPSKRRTSWAGVGQQEQEEEDGAAQYTAPAHSTPAFTWPHVDATVECEVRARVKGLVFLCAACRFSPQKRVHTPCAREMHNTPPTRPSRQPRAGHTGYLKHPLAREPLAARSRPPVTRKRRASTPLSSPPLAPPSAMSKTAQKQSHAYIINEPNSASSSHRPVLAASQVQLRISVCSHFCSSQIASRSSGQRSTYLSTSSISFLNPATRQFSPHSLWSAGASSVLVAHCAGAAARCSAPRFEHAWVLIWTRMERLFSMSS